MDEKLQKYIDKVDFYLRKLPAVERQDIIKELESEIKELKQRDNLDSDAIIERFGEAKVTARGYIGELIEDKEFSGKRIALIGSFWCVVGFSGMIVLPITVSLWLSFLLAAVLTPIAGIVKWIGSLFGYNIPFIMFQIGSFIATPFQAFLISIPCTGVFWIIALLFKKLTSLYIKTVCNVKAKI